MAALTQPPGFPATFANGQTLQGSASSPDLVELVFQKLVVQIFGWDPNAPAGPQWKAVRVGWQERGQPSWKIDEDVVVVVASIANDPYGRVRDNQYVAGDDTTVQQQMGYTRVWRVQFMCYGPNSFTRAQLILSAMTLEWVQNYLADNRDAVSPFYILGEFTEPRWVPENFQMQNWNRTDLTLRFNEQVNEAVSVPRAAGLDVTIITDTGAQETVEFSAE